MSKQRYEHNDFLSQTIRIHPVLTVLAAMLFCGPIGLLLWFFLENQSRQRRKDKGVKDREEEAT